MPGGMSALSKSKETCVNNLQVTTRERAPVTTSRRISHRQKPNKYCETNVVMYFISTISFCHVNLL